MKISVFGFEGISFLYLWLVGQAVKTPPSHGGNTGSIPVRTVYNLEIFGKSKISFFYNINRTNVLCFGVVIE